MDYKQRKKKYLDLLFYFGSATNTNRLKVGNDEVHERESKERERMRP
jgi:hypothetical protein